MSQSSNQYSNTLESFSLLRDAVLNFPQFLASSMASENRVILGHVSEVLIEIKELADRVDMEKVLKEVSNENCVILNHVLEVSIGLKELRQEFLVRSQLQFDSSKRLLQMVMVLNSQVEMG
jgi:hypothetical protein